MSRRTGALEVEQALETALRYCRVTEPETCPIGDCADRILAEDMRAAVNSPPFRRSAMDGFAVRSEDLWGASERRPVVLTVRGCNDAGSPVIRHIGKGEAAQIMTGGVLPEEADAVVKQEIVELRGQDTAVFSAPSKPGDCFSPIGEDLQEGEILAHAGETVDASALAAGAAAGLSMLSVRKQVRSAVICTGDELTLPGKPLGEGKIYGSSHLYLTTRLRQCGCADAKAYFAGDDPSGIAKMIRRQIEKGAQLIVTTGGVSVGRKDYLPAVIDMIGGEILFHGIDIKPGMPSMLSKAGETLILSLSGNPYSCACIFELIGRPVIAAMLGKQCVRDGIGCNCLIDIPAGNEGIREGDNVRVILLNNTL